MLRIRYKNKRINLTNCIWYRSRDLWIFFNFTDNEGIDVSISDEKERRSALAWLDTIITEQKDWMYSLESLIDSHKILLYWNEPDVSKD